ncbi:MAG: hypothetical protein LBG73_09615, partial [Spirochaetaceae bacterium]|nr:hypothetical protein [Spirochaetaceae bacterium]
MQASLFDDETGGIMPEPKQPIFRLVKPEPAGAEKPVLMSGGKRVERFEYTPIEPRIETLSPPRRNKPENLQAELEPQEKPPVQPAPLQGTPDVRAEPVPAFPAADASAPLPEKTEGVKTALLAIGTACAVLGFYHLFNFWTALGKPTLIALLFTAVFIGFNIAAGTIAGYVKKWYILPIAGFVVFFTMFGAFHTAYEQQKNRAALTADSAVFDAELSAIANERSLLKRSETDILSAIDADTKEADYWRAKSWAKYDDAQKRIETYRTELLSLREKSAELEVAKADVEKRKASDREDSGAFRFLSD